MSLSHAYFRTEIASVFSGSFFCFVSKKLRPELPQAAEIKSKVFSASTTQSQLHLATVSTERKQRGCWSDKTLIMSLPVKHSKIKGSLWSMHLV